MPSPEDANVVAKWRRVLNRIVPAPRLRSGNRVTALVDGNETFREMCEAIRAAGPGDFIYLLGWSLDIDVELIPGDRTSIIRKLFSAASARRPPVEIRVMIWSQVPVLPDYSAVNTAIQFINTLPGAKAVTDDALFSVFAAHHQKLLLVRRKGAVVGFCGGIDIHRNRVSEAKSIEEGQGWPLHDVHCKIEGPAVADLIDVFVQRWRGHPFAQSTLKAEGAGTPGPVGDAEVFVARTYNFPGPLIEGRFIGACRRDRSMREALLRTIQGATRFIYAEDQYMHSLDVANALRERLAHVQHVTLLTGHANISDRPNIERLRRQFIADILKSKGSPDNLGLFCLTTGRPKAGVPAELGRHTYIHAKTWIMDDELAIIGSANCDLRGMSSSSECGVVVFDKAASTTGTPSFAQGLRMRLWKEHLGVDIRDATLERRAWKVDSKRSRVMDLWASAVDHRKSAWYTPLQSLVPDMLNDLSAEGLRQCTASDRDRSIVLPGAARWF